MKPIITILFTGFISFVSAQNNINDVLKQIEANNLELAAYKQATEAQKIENKTGIYLENPSVDAAYLWGSPNEIGNRQDFSIMQSLDFAVTNKKGKIANLQNNQVESVYLLKRREILLQAKQFCIELSYLNKLNEELEIRLSHAKEINFAYQKRFNSGDANIIDKNKAGLNLLNAQKELENNLIERKNILSQLENLNGGKTFAFANMTYPDQELPIDFESFFLKNEANNPELQIAASDIEISKQQIGLNKAMGLPKFSAGYMLENVVGSRYQGVKVALTIPLWENKNNVKLAKARSISAEMYSAAVTKSNYVRYKALYEKAISLQKVVNDYQSELRNLNNSGLLKKALDKGELSLIEYVLEIQLYYDTINKMLESERDLQKLVAELYTFTL